MKAPRVTIVARDTAKPSMDWSPSGRFGLTFVPSMRALRFALAAAVSEVGLDVARAIVDRAGDGDEFLDLLATLPAEFHGDVLLVREDGRGILSAMARGGDRVLYALTAHDVRFYLETHALVASRVAMELSA